MPPNNQEPGTQSRSPLWVAGLQESEPSPAVLQNEHHQVAGLDAKRLFLNPGTPPIGDAGGTCTVLAAESTVHLVVFTALSSSSVRNSTVLCIILEGVLDFPPT